MAEEVAKTLAIRERIRAKRVQVDRWLSNSRPRKRRLIIRCIESVAFLQGA